MKLLEQVSKRYLAIMLGVCIACIAFLTHGGIQRAYNLTNPVYNELSGYTWAIWIEYPYYRNLQRDEVLAFHKALQPELDKLTYKVGTWDCEMYASWYMVNARHYFGGDLPIIAVAKVKLLDNYKDPHMMNIINVEGRWLIVEPQTLQVYDLAKYPAKILEIHFDS